MFHDLKSVPLSPSKGKGKEESPWQSGWWDFHPLVEQSQRPVEWSRSSTIFTAHPTQPLLTARHFSSSKQFIIPSPSPIASSPASYDPPTVISVAPSDDWLFAYFPGREGDGTGCLWKRGLQADSWNVKEWWSFARGAGVVIASWVGTAREWPVDSSASSTRLPPRGPRTPVSSPTLLLVTQTHQLNVCYLRAYIPSLKVISCSLFQPGVTVENQPNPVHDAVTGPGGVKLCTNAAIGLGYNESSILVASRSCLYPPPTAKPSQYNEMDLSLPLDMLQNNMPPSDPSIDWESWGEESVIELCEVQLGFDGFVMNISTNPLPSLHHPGPGLTQLSFICTPPTQPAADVGLSPSLVRKKDTERGRFYLAASYLDFGDHSSTPKSELVLHSISRHVTMPTNKSTWKSRHEATRLFSAGVLTFFAPCVVSSAHNGVGIYASILETSGMVLQRKLKEVPIGTVTVLRLPDLTDSSDWENSTIVSSVDRVGKELPLNAAISPNNTLLCTVSSSLWVTQTSIHTLPKQTLKNSRVSNTSLSSKYAAGVSEPGTSLIPSLASALASAILSRRTIADITHALSLPSVPLDEVVNTVCHALSILESHHNGSRDVLTWEALGMGVEMYHARALQADKTTEREALTARWQTAHDMCSVAACNIAFEDCKEGDSYDLDAIWQLVGLSSWFVNLIEKLMKECVLSCDLNKPKGSSEPSDDLFGSRPSSPTFESQHQALESPILLHLAQPYALTNLHEVLNHIIRFRTHLGSLTASGENAQIARDILIDLVDCSGVDLNALESLLSECVRDAKIFTGDETRKSLASCQPTSAMNAHLRKVIHKVTNSSVLDKPRLFIKPMDLVDGVARLSVEGQKKEKEKDVISKGMLQIHGPGLTCLRCGGRSEVGGDTGAPGHVSLHWRTWQKMWTGRCICGGSWANSGFM